MRDFKKLKENLDQNKFVGNLFLKALKSVKSHSIKISKRYELVMHRRGKQTAQNMKGLIAALELGN